MSELLLEGAGDSPTPADEVVLDTDEGLSTDHEVTKVPVARPLGSTGLRTNVEVKQVLAWEFFSDPHRKRLGERIVGGLAGRRTR